MPSTDMICPHCQHATAEPWKSLHNATDKGGAYAVQVMHCLACNGTVIALLRSGSTVVIYPRAAAKPPAPVDVPREYAKYFDEASLVLKDSPMASAALTRRLLQLLLRNVGGAKPGDLVDEIKHALPSLPPYLRDIDHIRDIANFAAHPNKNKNTGEVVDVEEGEAEWLLDMMELLLEFYFVKPKETEAVLKRWQDRKKGP